jgi:hypothetical protein
MGVEMEVFLIPRDNAFRPDGPALAAFVEALRAGRWVCDPQLPSFEAMRFEGMRRNAHAAKTGAYVAKLADRILRVRDGAGYAPLPSGDLAGFFTDARETDLQIVWPVENLGDRLRYPLDKDPPNADPEETYYDLEMWLSRDYVYKMSEQIDPFDDTTCACGAELGYDPESGNECLFFTSRILATCKECGQPFDASTRTAAVRDPWTNDTSDVPGGATFRFALVVDCGKCWPEDQDGFHAHADLHRLCETHFDRPFYEIVNVY